MAQSADIEVLIVGAQLSGLSVAYHIFNSVTKDVFVIDANHRSIGSLNWITGTKGPDLPDHTKMVLTPDDRGYFSLSHSLGREGARTYLRLKSNGVWLQRRIAESFDKSFVRNLGTVVLGGPKDDKKLQEEHNLYNELGFESSLKRFNEAEITDTFATANGRFTKGLFVGDDFIIDIDRYINALGAHLPESQISYRSILTGFEEKEDFVAVRYKVRDVNGKEEAQEITTKYLILATNGFWIDSNLQGLMRPFWTYVLCFEDNGPNTPNACYFSKNGHYFTRQNNVMIIGGQDTPVINNDFSKPNKREESLEALAQWTYDTLPRLNGKKPVAEHYGPFAETTDNLPIVGSFAGSERVIYFIGCQGDNQSGLSYAASLVPSIIDRKLLKSRDDADCIKLISPNRLSLRRKS